MHCSQGLLGHQKGKPLLLRVRCHFRAECANHVLQYYDLTLTHLTVPSADPVTMWSPSTLMATPRTSPEWPTRVVMHS